MIREQQAGAFVAALEADDTDQILIVDDGEEPTATTPPALLLELTEGTRGDPTPVPAELPVPLGREALIVIERFRFVLGYQCGWGAASIEEVIRNVRALMPRRNR
ncbi:MAG TPA: hypothetical protein VNN25_05050 [Thermoanaerobaculia bacterium]|nr:hypothetical protein [Thermoanaerobaculia bacterium]